MPKKYPMHTVLLVKIFDTKNKLFVFYQRESKVFVFFFAIQKNTLMVFIGIIRAKIIFILLF